MHKAKSVVIPTQTILFVGFEICSVSMTVRLPPEKCIDMIHLCKEILTARKTTIRKFAQLLDKYVSVEPGARYAALYYKFKEIEKDEALKIHKRSFDVTLYLSEESKLCIQWWIDTSTISFGLESDSSGLDWGCHDVTYDVTKMHGEWSYIDRLNHINFLELKVAFQVLKVLCPHVSHEHI